MAWERNQYTRKAMGQSNYVSKRNEENSLVDTLTSEQHEQIRELCAMRHLLHSGDIFNTESSDYRTCSNYFFELVEIEGVGSLDVSSDFEELITNMDLEFEYYEVAEEEREDYDTVFADLISRHNEEIELINTQIEDFLRDIDNQHGTKSAPTGKSRGRI